MEQQKLKRRKLLKRGLQAAGVVGVSAIAGVVQARGVCSYTAPQPEGPFYPVEDQQDKDNDLTQVKDHIQEAKGEPVILRGVVRDDNCKPVAGALVEIWQACVTGKYNHPGDPNGAALDPHFQYWGRAVTNEKGQYAFKTIKPGKYRATADWVRPPHIHLKAHLRGFEELTTQVYFSEDKELNKKDRILSSMSPAEQKNLIVDFVKLKKFSMRTGRFDIVMKSL